MAEIAIGGSGEGTPLEEEAETQPVTKFENFINLNQVVILETLLRVGIIEEYFEMFEGKMSEPIEVLNNRQSDNLAEKSANKFEITVHGGKPTVEKTVDRNLISFVVYYTNNRKLIISMSSATDWISFNFTKAKKYKPITISSPSWVDQYGHKKFITVYVILDTQFGLFNLLHSLPSQDYPSKSAYR